MSNKLSFQWKSYPDLLASPYLNNNKTYISKQYGSKSSSLLERPCGKQGYQGTIRFCLGPEDEDKDLSSYESLRVLESFIGDWGVS